MIHALRYLWCCYQLYIFIPIWTYLMNERVIIIIYFLCTILCYYTLHQLTTEWSELLNVLLLSVIHSQCKLTWFHKLHVLGTRRNELLNRFLVEIIHFLLHLQCCCKVTNSFCNANNLRIRFYYTVFISTKIMNPVIICIYLLDYKRNRWMNF